MRPASASASRARRPRPAAVDEPQLPCLDGLDAARGEDQLGGAGGARPGAAAAAYRRRRGSRRPTPRAGPPRRCASATITSQASASSKPPPSAKPCTAATVGIGSSSTPVYAARAVGRWRTSSASLRELRSLRSAPTQKARSLVDVSTVTRASGSAASASQAAAMERAISVDTAFMALGRSSTSSATYPCAPHDDELPEPLLSHGNPSALTNVTSGVILGRARALPQARAGAGPPAGAAWQPATDGRPGSPATAGPRRQRSWPRGGAGARAPRRRGRAPGAATWAGARSGTSSRAGLLALLLGRRGVLGGLRPRRRGRRRCGPAPRRTRRRPGRRPCGAIEVSRLARFTVVPNTSPIRVVTVPNAMPTRSAGIVSSPAIVSMSRSAISAAVPRRRPRTGPRRRGS